MTGVKGSGGPPPKRESQRRRRNAPATQPNGVTKAAAARKVPVPRGDPKWHPIAKRWFAALGKSGQSHFYEPSDWATAVVIAESISRELMPQAIISQGEVVGHETTTVKAASLAAWLKGMTALMVTEGDRRRLALELQRPKSGDDGGSDVARIDDYRRRLESG